jgi:ribosomal protein L12E/L44/L45/RPP1/RPP2
MYGPNAAAVLDILDRLEGFGPDEARPLAEAWLAIPKSDRDRARKASQKLAESDTEVYRYLQLAREAVGTWAAVTGPFPDFVNAEPNWGRICSQSAEAALDAATAVILEGTLEETHYEALLEPWSETMATLDEAAEVAEAARAARAEGSGPDSEEEAAGDEEAEEEGDGEFGPNTDAITDFLTRLWLLTPEQIGRLVGGWQNADREVLKAAHERLRALVEEDPEWRDQVRKAQEKLAPWLNAGRVAEQAGFLGQAGQGESRKMAGPALADAVAALVLGDLLERADAEVLYAAWFNLIGAPALPVASEEDPDENSGE